MEPIPESSGKKKSKQAGRQSIDDLVNDFVLKLKRGELQGGNTLATLTIDLIRNLISRKNLSTVDDLIEHLHHVGAVLTAARPQEQVTGNIVRRILRIVREEGKGLVLEIEREEEKERSAVASAVHSLAASPSSSPPMRSQSPSPPPSLSLKRSFSNMDVSLSLHSLLDQPSSTTSLTALASHATSPVSSNSSTPPFSPAHGPSSARPRSKPELAREREEERQQREWMNARLKPAIIEEIGLLMDEIALSESGIAAQATEHIYANETILTYGLSATVTAFLKFAAKVRRFQVMVVETAPSYAGHQQAMLLSASPYPIETTVITDSAVYAIMPAVNKCIIGCHAVMANGSLIVPAGGFNIALAAHHHSVPLVVLTGLHKLSPLYSHHSSLYNIHQSPSHILSYDLGGSSTSSVRVDNPLYEEVGAEMVDLLITNVGGHNPSYIYRLLSDHYHAMDYVLRRREEGTGGAGWAAGRGEDRRAVADALEDGKKGKDAKETGSVKGKDKEERGKKDSGRRKSYDHRAASED